MNTKNQTILAFFSFLLTATALVAQSNNKESNTAPLMMFPSGARNHGEEDQRLPAPVSTDPRSRTTDRGSSEPPRGTLQNDEREENNLTDALNQQQHWTTQKENAIKEVQTSKSSLNPLNEIEKAQAAQTELKNKASGLLEAVPKDNPIEAERLTSIAHAYLSAAEEAEQVERLWTLRHQKNAISWPHRKEREQAQTLIQQASQWAALDPATRREKTLSDNSLDHYQNADAALRKAQEAWEQQAASRWAVENQQEILRQAAIILEQRKAEFDQINLRKTTAGRVAAAAQKLTDVLQYVSIQNVSPALFSKGIAIIADVINRRNEKFSLKAATRALDDHLQIAEDLNDIAVAAEKDAPEKESHARRLEAEAQQNEVAVAIAAAEKLKQFFNGAALWKEKMEQLQRAVDELQQEEHSHLEWQGKAAREARSSAIAHQDQVKQLQQQKAQQEVGLNLAQHALISIQDQIRDWRADHEAASQKLDALKISERQKQQEVTAFNETIHAITDTLSSVDSDAAKADQHATVLEKEYRKQHQDAFNRDLLVLRKINRAKARARAYREAYRAVWPIEAARDGITETHPPEIADTSELPVDQFASSMNLSSETEDREKNPSFIPPNPPALSVATSNSSRFDAGDSMESMLDNRTLEALNLELLAGIAQKMQRQLIAARKSFQKGKQYLELAVGDQLTEEETEGLYEEAISRNVQNATEKLETRNLLELAIRTQEEKTAKALEKYYELNNNPTEEVTTERDDENLSNTEIIEADLSTSIMSDYLAIQGVHFYFQKCRDTEEQKKEAEVHTEGYHKKLGNIADMIRSKKK